LVEAVEVQTIMHLDSKWMFSVSDKMNI